jgi:hypothetical protein
MTTTSPEPARRLPPTVLATCVLPRDDRLRFDEDAFREHIRLVAAHMTPGSACCPASKSTH